MGEEQQTRDIWDIKVTGGSRHLNKQQVNLIYKNNKNQNKKRKKKEKKKQES